MTTSLTAEEVAAGDQVASALERLWGWYLAGGILALIFGFVVLSYKHATLFAIAYFAGALFIATGIFELVGSAGLLRHRWLYILMGLVSIGVGIALFVWPKETLYVTTILIGWVLLLWGITNIVMSLFSTHTPYWWVVLIKGGIELLLGVWAIRHPGNALTVLVVVIGLWAILWGVVEIIAAFAAHHAKREWAKAKAASAA
jgi:uncharacterized membrane protein HdeD (DUF308 family)